LGTGAVGCRRLGLIPLIILAAVVLTGALALLGPAILKTRFGVDEVVTTLLLNFIVILFVSMLLEGAAEGSDGAWLAKVERVIEEAQLPRLIQGKRLHFGFVLAIVSAVVVWVIMKKTTLGYEMRAVGHNAEAAAFRRHSGQPGDGEDGASVGRACRACRLSEVAGLKGNLTLDLSPGLATPASSWPCWRCSIRSG
jgi:ABC-type uncharacterized transport system permease subunit